MIEPSPRVHVPDAPRRALRAARHHLGGDAPDLLAAVRSVVAVHSSDPLTPHLALRARLPGYATDDLERAFAETRMLWRLHAMRRTLFVVPSDLVPVLQAAVGDDVARRERRRLEGQVTTSLPDVREADVGVWLEDVAAAVFDVLGDGLPRSTTGLAALVPDLTRRIRLGSGRWATEAPLSTRLLSLLAMESRLVRQLPEGSWRSSRYRWASVRTTRGVLPTIEPATARADLARHYLASHGPATADDLRWWTGWTVARTRAALADVEAAPVTLDRGERGYVLPEELDDLDALDDLDDLDALDALDALGRLDGRTERAGSSPRRRRVALLPGLDPTPMGWRDRRASIDPAHTELWDRNGNVGPTVWVDGEVVGSWGQRPDGEVVVGLLGDPDARLEDEVRDELAAEVDALGRWLDGVVVTPRFRTPLERALASG